MFNKKEFIFFDLCFLKSFVQRPKLYLYNTSFFQNRLSGTVGWAWATKVGRLVGPYHWRVKRYLPSVCPVSCPALMGGCKETVHARAATTHHQCSIHYENGRVAGGTCERR